MPGRDGTGPLGAGPMTGRGAGRCAGFNNAGRANATQGRGPCGRGLGRRQGGGGGRGGRRFGWGVQAAPVASPSDAERSMLQGQAEVLQQQLDVIKKRLDALAVSADAVKP